MSDCPTKRCGDKIKRGAAGLTRAALGIDRASDAVTQQRRDICRECEHATRNKNRLDRPTKGLTSLSRCKVCDCFIALKSRDAREHCPLEKW